MHVHTQDKFENEELIAHSWPEDVWFHVDNLSSAHIYLRMSESEREKLLRELGEQNTLFRDANTSFKNKLLDVIPKDVLDDMCQLTKENSIRGSKESAVRIVYTLASNLKKTGNMVTGEVGFHDMKLVRYVKNVTRDRDTLNRLKKTKREEFPDLRALKSERDKRELKFKKNIQNELKRREQEEIEEKRRLKELYSYDSMFSEANMRSNRDTRPEDDFDSGGYDDDESGDFDDDDDFI